MVTTVYLSDYFLKAAIGKAGKNSIEIHQAFQVELPPGCMVNGNIVSEEAVSELLAGVWKEHRLPAKRVRVIVNAMPVTLRKLEVPAMREKELRSMLQKELGSSEGEVLIAYRKLSGDRKKFQIYAAAAQKSYLEKYQRVFRKAGIEPTEFVPSRICLEKALSHMEVLRGRAGIVQILDGVQMTSVLWDGQEVVYAARSGIYAEHGSFQFGLEVSRSVSKLMQFCMTQEIRQEVRQVYLSGISEADFLICEEAVLQMVPNVGVDRLEGDAALVMRNASEASFGKYLSLAGALFERKNEINLLPPKKKKKTEKKHAEFWQYAELPLLLAVGCTAITAAFLFSNQVKREVLEDLNRYLKDDGNVAKCQELDSLELENGLLENQTAALRYMDQALASYPEMNASVLNTIEACAGDRTEVSVRSYLAKDGLLTLDVAAREADSCSRFVEELQRSGLFRHIDYTGYVYSQAGELYQVNLQCYLNEGAGKEEVDHS